MSRQYKTWFYLFYPDSIYFIPKCKSLIWLGSFDCNHVDVCNDHLIFMTLFIFTLSTPLFISNVLWYFCIFGNNDGNRHKGHVYKDMLKSNTLATVSIIYRYNLFGTFLLNESLDKTAYDFDFIIKLFHCLKSFI